jgi:hypothetical protein
VVNIPSSEEAAEEPDWKLMQNTISEAHRWLTNTAVFLQTPLTRWPQVHVITVPKNKGSNRIDKYRNIHIYECNLNAGLSIKWREAAAESEKERIIHSSQFGSRGQLSAQHPILWETMHSERARMTRQEYAQVNYDAKACYDRIIPSLASEVSKSFGVSKDCTTMHQKFLSNITYTTKVTGADKPSTYNHTVQHPIYGTGQGSGNRPYVWAFLSSILLNILENSCSGSKYKGTFNIENIKMVNTAFVDDVNTHHTLPPDCKITLGQHINQDSTR